MNITNFDNLQKLNDHLNYIGSKLDQKGIRAVGGSVRDVLFALKDEIDDIDITLSADPKSLYQTMDKSDVSFFMTEKYGTITVIPKNIMPKIQYEITPFRIESQYDDFRRPKAVERTHSLLEDSKRREFTINCLYYTYLSISDVDMTKNISDQLQISIQRFKSASVKSKKSKKQKVDEDAKDSLCFGNDGILYVVLNDQDIITKLIKNGEIDIELLPDIIKKVKIGLFSDQNQDSERIFSGNIGIVIDPRGGTQDMADGLLRTAGEPDHRFSEDALRIIRAIRFVNVINQTFIRQSVDHHIDIEKETRQGLKQRYYLIRSLPKERIQIELNKVLVRGNLFNFIVLCEELNILSDLFPSFAKTKGVRQPVRYHAFDVYEHTMLCLWELQKLSSDKNLLMAILYHDVGKVDQFYLYSVVDPKKANQMGDLNHRETSSKIAVGDLERLGFGAKDIKEICRYIDGHHKPEEILNAKEDNRIKKIRKIFSESSYKMFCNLLIMARADRLGQYNPIQSNNISELDYLKGLLDKIKTEEGQFRHQDLAIDGDTIMKIFNLTAGPLVGKMIGKAFDRASNDIKNRNNQREIIKYLKSLKIS